jgi:hypothetical protein
LSKSIHKKLVFPDLGEANTIVVCSTVNSFPREFLSILAHCQSEADNRRRRRFYRPLLANKLSPTSKQSHDRPEAKTTRYFQVLRNVQQAANTFNRCGSSTAAKRRPKD